MDSTVLRNHLHYYSGVWITYSRRKQTLGWYVITVPENTKDAEGKNRPYWLDTHELHLKHYPEAKVKGPFQTRDKALVYAITLKSVQEYMQNQKLRWKKPT